MQIKKGAQRRPLLLNATLSKAVSWSWFLTLPDVLVTSAFANAQRFGLERYLVEVVQRRAIPREE